jgi:hypothetical protein
MRLGLLQGDVHWQSTACERMPSVPFACRIAQKERTLGPEQVCQIAQPCGSVWMMFTKHALADVQRPAEQRLGFFVFSWLQIASGVRCQF